MNLALLPDPWKKLITKPASQNRDQQQPVNSGLDDSTKLLNRASAYLNAAPNVGEGTRNDTAFRLAGSVLSLDQNGLRLSPEQTLALMNSWNAGNSPPLPDEELKRVVDSASASWTDQQLKPDRDYNSNGKTAAGSRAKSQQHPRGDRRNGSIAQPDAQRLQETVESKFRPFPCHRLPYPMNEIVRSLSKAMGTDGSFAFNPMAAICAVFGAHARSVILKRGWVQFLILWTISIAESTSGKSSAYTWLMKRVKEKEFESIREFEHDRKQWAEENELRAVKLKAWESDYKKAKTEDREHLDDEKPELIDPPRMRRKWFATPTNEAIGHVLMHDPSPKLLATDEIAGIVLSRGAYKGGKGGDMEMMLEWFNAGPFLKDLKVAESTLVEHTYISMNGTTQLSKLKEIAGGGNIENGFIPRFLKSAPPYRPIYWTDEEVSERIEKLWADLLERLTSLQPDDHPERGLTPRLMRMSPGGKSVFTAYFDRVAKTSEESMGPFKAELGKLRDNCGRLALLFETVEQAWTGSDGFEISEENFRRAVDVAEWYENEARRLYSVLAMSPEDLQRAELIDYIVSKYGEQVTVKEFAKAKKRHFGNTAGAKEALVDLQAAGLGELVKVPPAGGGRPSLVFKVTQPSASAKKEESSAGPVEIDL